MHALKQMVRGRLKKIERLFKYATLLQYRLSTSARRPLPDFIIIGAQKSGTSSLFNYLSQHPQLLPSYKKEVRYFDGGINPAKDNYAKGVDWYRAQFPIKTESRLGSKAYEASPIYLFNPLAPKRIADLVPQVKLIALLRNPTERAVSHYFHEKRNGREPLHILEAMQSEEERLLPFLEKGDYKNSTVLQCSYKTRGLYYDQIKRYLDYFPMEHLFVINSEKLFAEPDRSLRQIFEFVGVDADFRIRDLKPRNVGSNRSGINSNVYEYLNEYFRPHNQQLYELVGENYGW